MAEDVAGDFDAFYEARYRHVVGQLYALTGSMAEAEDAVQEAFARAWQQWPRLNRDGEPEAWIRTVAYRLAVSSWRRSVNRLSAHRRAHVDAHVPAVTPDHLALVTALRKISTEQRLAVVLYHFAGLSVEEIAAQTGAGPSAVKARLARGRRALAPYLSEADHSRTDAVPAGRAGGRES